MKFELDFQKMKLDDIFKTRDLLKNLIDTRILDLDIAYSRTKEPLSFVEKDKGCYKQASVGETWGNLFDCAWFRLSGKIPFEQLDSDLLLRFDISGEALLFNSLGNPVKGFTNGSSVFDRRHGEPSKKYYAVNEFIDSNGEIELFLDCACNDLFGNYQNNGKIVNAEIVTRNTLIEELYYDVESCIYLLDIYEESSVKYQELFNDLHEVYINVAYQKPNFTSIVKAITDKYLSSKKDIKHTVYAIGHAHLDLAWLWPIRETKRKLLRTLTNVFYLCDKYPDFKFGISQPQLLEWLETESPELFKKVKKYYLLGQIELQGGAWVEMDTNVSGEEALVRQFLYGMKYYKEKFDFRPKSLWLPDVFGYSGNMPQIIKKSGLDYFMTIKLSWCLINKFPYHSFKFNGIDGSTVLAHMPPEGNYNSSASAFAVNKTYQEYNEKDISDESLLLFGIGDGGGGPGDEHLARIHRNNKMADLPHVKITSSENFFNKLNERIDILPTYQGELYLENHQGTYTSQANIKKYNRYMENKLKTVEYLQSYFDTKAIKQELDNIWKEVLLFQFHDILPGSSIKRVYTETLARYKELDKELDDLILQITNQANSLELFTAQNIFNPNQNDTTLYYSQNDNYRKVSIEGLTSNIIEDEVYKINSIALTDMVETNQLLVKIDLKTGKIKSCFDKEKKVELIGDNEGNNLGVYLDLGDAWNITYDYRRQTPSSPVLEFSNLHESNDFYEYHFTYSFKESTIIEAVRIYKNQKLIDFNHDVDWQNVGYMLRTSFDLNIKAKTAISDIQFGNISRSRLNETSIEQAQIEVPSQNWISIYDGTNGAALLNNGKYGHYIKGNILDINLLRSTNWPCVKGDIGKTNYKYSLLLHNGDINQVDIKAQEMNTSYVALPSNSIPQKLFTISNNNIHYSALKIADNLDGYILRLHENSGINSTTKLIFTSQKYRVIETNLIEETITDFGENTTLEIDFTPFEIKTFRLIKV